MNWPTLLFTFNEYSGLLLPFALQGIIMSVLFFRRAYVEQSRSDVFLGLLLTIYTLRVSFWMLGFAGWYDIRDWHTTFMFYFPFNFWLAVGPVMYFYFLSVTNESFRFERKHWLHFIPIAIYLLRGLVLFVSDILINHWIENEPLPNFYGTKGELLTHGFGFLDQYWTYLESLSVVIYIIITLKLFSQYRTYINNNFSDTEHIDFSWIRNFLLVNLLSIAIWISFNAANLFLDEPLSYIQDWYSFFFLGIILYYLSIAGYHAGRYVKTINPLHFQPDQPDEENAMDESMGQLTTLHEKLLRHMTDEKPFLDGDLSLSSLAKQLKCQPSNLSKAVNKLSEVNFNHFVNTYRVSEFKQKVKGGEMKQFSLLALAHDSGFNSKATFNRAFKKLEGLSPSAYISDLPSYTD